MGPQNTSFPSEQGTQEPQVIIIINNNDNNNNDK